MCCIKPSLNQLKSKRNNLHTYLKSEIYRSLMSQRYYVHVEARMLIQFYHVIIFLFVAASIRLNEYICMYEIVSHMKLLK